MVQQATAAESSTMTSQGITVQLLPAYKAQMDQKKAVANTYSKQFSLKCKNTSKTFATLRCGFRLTPGSHVKVLVFLRLSASEVDYSKLAKQTRPQNRELQRNSTTSVTKCTVTRFRMALETFNRISFILCLNCTGNGE